VYNAIVHGISMTSIYVVYIHPVCEHPYISLPNVFKRNYSARSTCPGRCLIHKPPQNSVTHKTYENIICVYSGVKKHFSRLVIYNRWLYWQLLFGWVNDGCSNYCNIC